MNSPTGSCASCGSRPSCWDSSFSGSVSGNGVSQGVLDATLEGPGLLTGGSFGLEASLPAFVLCTATGVILVVMAVRRGHVLPPKWKRRA